MPYYDPGTAQLGFVTRRRPRLNRAQMIEEQAAMLPQLKSLERTREFEGNLYDIQKQGLDLQSKGLESDIAYRNQMTDIASKQAKEARNIGYANLGLNTAFGLAKFAKSPDTDQSILSTVGQGVKRIGSEVWEGLTGVYDWAGSLFQ